MQPTPGLAIELPNPPPCCLLPRPLLKLVHMATCQWQFHHPGTDQIFLSYVMSYLSLWFLTLRHTGPFYPWNTTNSFPL